MMFNLNSLSQFYYQYFVETKFNHYIKQSQQSCWRILVYIYFKYFECDSTLMSKIKYIL